MFKTKEHFLSIVMPVFNEKDTILEIINKALELDFLRELIVVDDGSTDGTRRLLNENKFDERVRIIFHPRNFGKGKALQTGFKAAQGEIVATQDADLEYSPVELKELVLPILNGKAPVAYGSRFSKKRPHKIYFLHSLGNKFLTYFTNLLYASHLTDMETGYKVFRREVIKDIEIKSKDFSVEPELTAKILRQNIRICEVPISYQARTYNEGKKIKWIHGLMALWVLLKYRFIR